MDPDRELVSDPPRTGSCIGLLSDPAAVMIALLLLRLLAAYLVAGVVFAAPFLAVGVRRIDPAAREGTWGFRLLILPGTVLLWPLLLRRWINGSSAPPEERNAHRCAARRPSTP